MAYDLKSRTVTVPGQSYKVLTTVVEDVRVIVDSDNLSQLITEAIDKLDESIEDSLTLLPSSDSDISHDLHSDAESNLNLQPIDEQTDVHGEINRVENNETESENSDPINSQLDDSEFDKQHLPNIGDHVEVLWPADSTYFPGVITEITANNEHVIVYDDGDIETLNMSIEEWRFNDIANDNDVNTESQNENSTLQSSTVSHLPTLQRNEKSDLQSLFDHFGNRPFLTSHAQRFPQAAIINSYKREEEAFKRIVREVCRETVPSNANVISSHVLYKLKLNDDNTFKLKARIAPHGNQDSMQYDLRSDCCMCSHTGLRIVLMTDAMYKWQLVKADVKMHSCKRDSLNAMST